MSGDHLNRIGDYSIRICGLFNTYIELLRRARVVV